MQQHNKNVQNLYNKFQSQSVQNSICSYIDIFYLFFFDEQILTVNIPVIRDYYNKINHINKNKIIIFHQNNSNLTKATWAEK